MRIMWSALVCAEFGIRLQARSEPEHQVMGWETSDRRARLPKDWTTRVEQTKANAHGRCQALMHNGTRCVEPGTDCDHIEHGDNHAQSNLQWLCGWHHDRKTTREAREAKAKKPKASVYRPREAPFGLK